MNEEMESFGLFWPGKTAAELESVSKCYKHMALLEEESKCAPTTGNIYIEGDNLDAIKLLREDYFEGIKLIYIDPPFNTGKDFVYKDKLGAGMGKKHAQWLNMIYPRLLASRDLLKADGVIFISIDDCEMKYLNAICDEVFGEENFIANIIWERSSGPINLKKHFSQNHEYVLCYAKNKEKLRCKGLKRTGKSISRYRNPDNDFRGAWIRSDLSVGPVKAEHVYEIITPSGRRVLPPSGRCWQVKKETYDEYVADNRIWFGKNGNAIPSIKRFLAEVKDSMTPVTIWKCEDVGTTHDAKRRLKKMFGGKALFEYPKSVALIMRIIELYTDSGDYILDFFSGSGTTAEAVMRQNAKDGGQRKFICVQLPEPCAETSEAYKQGYLNICQIGKERISRAGEQVAADCSDIGFKLYRIIN